MTFIDPTEMKEKPMNWKPIINDGNVFMRDQDGETLQVTNTYSCAETLCGLLNELQRQTSDTHERALRLTELDTWYSRVAAAAVAGAALGLLIGVSV